MCWWNVQFNYAHQATSPNFLLSDGSTENPEPNCLKAVWRMHWSKYLPENFRINIFGFLCLNYLQTHDQSTRNHGPCSKLPDRAPQLWRQRRENHAYMVSDRSKVFCVTLKFHTNPVKYALGLNIFCFCEQFDRSMRACRQRVTSKRGVDKPCLWSANQRPFRSEIFQFRKLLFSNIFGFEIVWPNTHLHNFQYFRDFARTFSAFCILIKSRL